MFSRKQGSLQGATTGALVSTAGPLAANASPSGVTLAGKGPNGERAVLVGKGTRVSGEIGDCDVVEIQGVFEGDVVSASVVVREGGSFKGQMQTEHLEVHGTIEGAIEVRGLLDIRSTGCVTAEVSYGQLSVATGGKLAGNIQEKKIVQLEGQSVPAKAELIGSGGGAHPGLNGSAHPEMNGGPYPPSNRPWSAAS